MAASLIGRFSGSVSKLGAALLRPANGTTKRQLCLPVSYPGNSRTLMTPGTTTGVPTVPIYKAQGSLLKVCQPFMNSVRTAVRFSRGRGKPIPVKAVNQRFYRLHWGIFIRTRAGKHKGRWRKPEWILDHSKYHVFCNKKQSKLLDRMITPFWKKKRFYPDDPYAPYQKRTGMRPNTDVPRFLP